jgi:hypothetical protein
VADGKTTYVLGAGASKDAGYPLASCMGRELSQWMETRGEYDETLLWMRDRFEDPHDMECVLTTMDGIVARNERSVESVLIGNVYKPAIIQALRAWFLEIREKQEGSYRSFAGQVIKQGDTVISFNYDDSLDRQLKVAGLWSLGDGYGFPVEGFEVGSSVTLLKLHGSINWFAALFNGNRGGVVNLDNAFGSRPVFVQPDTRFLGYEETDPRTPKEFGFVPPLILPTERKKFYFETNLGRQWKNFWDVLWSLAAENLHCSEKVVLCGYSMVSIDERAHRLLLEEISPSALIEVCCGGDSERIVNDFQAVGRTARAAESGFFGDWVRQHTTI